MGIIGKEYEELFRGCKTVVLYSSSQKQDILFLFVSSGNNRLINWNYTNQLFSRYNILYIGISAMCFILCFFNFFGIIFLNIYKQVGAIQFISPCFKVFQIFLS